MRLCRNIFVVSAIFIIFTLAHVHARDSKAVKNAETTADLTDDEILDEVQRAAFLYFWEQADPNTGQVKDRSKVHGINDTFEVSSIAATGFGLTSLAIAHNRSYWDRAAIERRVEVTLDFIRNTLPHVNGFYYHFVHMSTGERMWDCELSSIDTSLLLAGVQTVRQYFGDNEQIVEDATEIYNRIDWVWMMNGTEFLNMGWKPESGFLNDWWNRYCELMILVLQAIGSPTHPIPKSSWDAFSRPKFEYDGISYIHFPAPIFVHQFAHAWIDFRNRTDRYTDYFQNSVNATKATKRFFTQEMSALYPSYSENFWGVTASDTPYGYDAWGGPPLMGRIDGSIVPCAAAGSIPFLPEETIAVLRNLRASHSVQAWDRYGWVDAFNPLTNWTNEDVIGIDVGITMLMAENYRSEFVWTQYMKDESVQDALNMVNLRVGGKTDDEMLDDIQRAAFLFFWEQAHPLTGQVKDRAYAWGTNDTEREVSSIAATGFGLASLAIAHDRNYHDRAEIEARVQLTIEYLWYNLTNVNGFYYHFISMSTGERVWNCELSSIDTSLLVAGIQMARQYFSNNSVIVDLGKRIFDRVDWRWMMADSPDFLNMGWTPENGFLNAWWDRYCELMILLIQALGSDTHPVPLHTWDAFSRPDFTYGGINYIHYPTPIFVHQFSHAFIDFRGISDSYTDYFENSVNATKATKLWNIQALQSNFTSYHDEFWGLTSSDSRVGYVAWGGPPAQHADVIDGSIVPCAAAGSIPFLPHDTLRVVRNIYENYPRAWQRYGFIDSFCPIPGSEWFNEDVIGIDVGVTMLMAENYRSGFVWKYFMQDTNILCGLRDAGFEGIEGCHRP